MRGKIQCHLNPKHILVCPLFILFLFLVWRSSTSVSPLRNPPSTVSLSPQQSSKSQMDHDLDHQDCPPDPRTPACTKIPPSLSQTLIHYATSNITPQQTINEVSVTEKVLRRKSPCNFLVFGLGHDSLMWAALNHGGRTLFVEEDKSWIDQIKLRFPNLESYHAVYDTKVRQSEELLKATADAEECKDVGDPLLSKCGLALKGLAKEVYEVEWDLIMVDAPTGYHDEAPGRMGAIYTAGLMARNRADGETDVFVHDVDRIVEDKFSKAFLCEGYVREQVGRLRHFTIPSHRTLLGRPFCP
ncbi:hypothetical protein Nepgr_023463 [Nepenthes gracilis]|uniref:Polysaccharide biosynthesis domain-containing protein n=1 Tax=Nepenthes gracilis TaxID=150966 RepID=A0AAD3T4B8_NEPGR|nr:hypothetical protein Nepgr_023463 [Nepenthes gracilis]